MTPREYFAGREDSRLIFEALLAAVGALGSVELRAMKSEIAFRRRVNFAFAWIPGRYLNGPRAPLVLTIGLRRRDGSPRWKEIAEPARGRFTHHLELRSPADIDDEVVAWLREAWEASA